ncbi:RalA-binding protein 1 [Aphelenchoides avenae]|nr:RalA-binding protein 1 [Aphelenchus avenae]
MNIWKKNKEKRATEKHSRNSSADLGAFAPVLGVPLPQALVNSKCYDGHPVPALIRQCIDYVTEYGLNVEGIYRVSSTKPRLDELERMANAGEPFCFTDPHDAAGLLKRFLRQLPEHVLTNAARVQFESAGAKCKCEGLDPCRCDSVREIKHLLRLLPSENYYLLAYVFLHSQRVVQEQRHNKMNLAALGVLLQAMMNLSQKEVRIFLLNASNALATDAKEPLVQLFDDVEIKP